MMKGALALGKLTEQEVEQVFAAGSYSVCNPKKVRVTPVQSLVWGSQHLVQTYPFLQGLPLG